MVARVRGVDYDLIEGHVADLIRLNASLPADHIFIPDTASNEPAPSRPFVSFLIVSPNADTPPLEFNSEPALEYWRLEITDSTDGAYTITIDSTDYSFIASGNTTTQIRDGLVTAMSIDPSSTSTATGTLTASIDIESTVVGKKLLISASPPSITVDILRENRFRIGWAHVELMCDIKCFGEINTLSPDPQMTGSALANKIKASFLSYDDTQAMRSARIVPRRARVQTQNVDLNNEAQTVGSLQVMLATNLLHVSSQSSVESASVNVNEVV